MKFTLVYDQAVDTEKPAPGRQEVSLIIVLLHQSAYIIGQTYCYHVGTQSAKLAEFDTLGNCEFSRWL